MDDLTLRKLREVFDRYEVPEILKGLARLCDEQTGLLSSFPGEEIEVLTYENNRLRLEKFSESLRTDSRLISSQFN